VLWEIFVMKALPDNSDLQRGRNTMKVIAGLWSVALSLLCIALAMPSMVIAQDAWPVKPIRLLVPFPPGGAVDIVGRLVADRLGRELGQAVVVDNRPGVNGSLGSELVARAKPDGYTLVVSSIGTHAINQSINRNVKYDARKDFTHIALLARTSNVLLASPAFSGKTVQDVVAQSRARPNSLNVAITGYGSSGHMAVELFRQVAELDFNVVPYKGDASAISDLISGEVDLLFNNYMAAVSSVKGGRLHALAVTDTARNALFPDVPTMRELGLDVVINPWMGVAGPANLAPAIAGRLNQALNRILEMPDVKNQLAASGLVAMPGTMMEASAYIDAEVEKWSRVVKEGRMAME
jgi:tripartite-type tricarboxylate transporter receptor subunit TctC